MPTSRLLPMLACLLAAGVTFAADPLSDVRGWPANGLPVAGEWAAAHDLKWTVPHLQAGRRILPQTPLVIRSLVNIPKQATNLDAFAAEFAWISANNLPLILRHQSQFSQDMTVDRGTYPGNTAVQWRESSPGVLDSTPLCDCFAPASLWAAQGTAYGSSGYLAKLQAICPNPAWVGLWDNNEGGYPNVKDYSKPVAGGRVWKTYAELTGISLKMRDRADVLGYGTDPYAFWPEFYGLRRGQYDAMYGAFRSSLTGWNGKPLWRTAYSAAAIGGGMPAATADLIGPAPEAVCYEGAGVSCYPGENGSSNLLSSQYPGIVAANVAAWEWSKADNPNAYRVVFVSLGGKAALAPALAGQHEPVTPALFQSWCEYMAWLARPANGGPVLLQHWIGSSTKPGDAFFDALRQQELATLGRQDLAGLTQGDYSIAPAKAADSICRSEVRDFWREGVSVPATVSNPDVRIVAVKRGLDYLVYLWTPKVLTGDVSITVGGVTLSIEAPSNGGAYWILEPPPPVGLIPRKVN